MRWLGIDLGERRIGLAMSDPLGITAQGYQVLKSSGSEKKDVQTICQLLTKEEINSVVLGLPRNLNGTEGPMAQKVRHFGQALQDEANIRVIYWDEWLSTAAAQRVMIEADISRRKRKEKVDQVAAVIILQNFLDSQLRMNM